VVPLGVIFLYLFLLIFVSLRLVPLRVTKLESKKAKVENGWAWPQFLLPDFYFLLGRQLPVA